MADHKMELKDEVKSADGSGDTPQAQPAERRDYTVKAESGIFFDHEQHDKGSKISLDKVSARNFLREDDVEPREDKWEESDDNAEAGTTGDEQPKGGESANDSKPEQDFSQNAGSSTPPPADESTAKPANQGEEA